MEEGAGLVADRFIVTRRRGTRGGRLAIDLATRERVEIVQTVSGGPSEHARWSRRCDRLHNLHHPSRARLEDWGLLGESRRFEAWRMSAREYAPNVPSLRRIERVSVSLVAERIGEARRFDAVVLHGPRGSGLSTAIAELAGTLRRHGIVPVDAGALTGGLLRLLASRTIVVIATGDVTTAWRAVQALDFMSITVRAVVFALREELPGLPSIALARLPTARLVDAVVPRPAQGAERDRITAAARRAMGWPGRFTASLWRGAVMREPVGVSLVPRAAEEAAVYEVDATHAPPLEPIAHASAWPAGGEVASLRNRLRLAIDAFARGRHVSGERTLRELQGYLLRRRDYPSAVAASIALASLSRRRGHTRAARTALHEIKPLAATIKDDEALTKINGVLGTVAIDEGRLEEAAEVLAVASAAARAAGSVAARTAVELAYVRCLFWMGHYDAAEERLGVLERGAGFGTVGPDALAVATARARVSIGRGQLADAMKAGEAALAIAQTLNDPGSITKAAVAAAFVHLSAGDYMAVHADVSMCLVAARAARDPLGGLRARLLAAEATRRQGAGASTSALARQLERATARDLPPIVRARVDLVRALASGRGGPDIARDLAQRTGLPALVLFAPAAERAGAARSAEAVVDIVQTCQSAHEDRALLDLLCARLRTALRASAVVCCLEDRGSFIAVACDGGRLDIALATRVVSLDRPLVPHAGLPRLDGGAPVRYAGRLIGALLVHWPAADGMQCPDAGLLLATAAAAAGPALASMATVRSRPAATAPWELLGTSATMTNLKDAVERAAAAPFPTLIEGESGSGKELVARAIHRRGPRRDRPFCTLNCAALPEELVESELFGHARGAFTGAASDRPGVFEEAHTGTLFLDEIGELSPRAQAKVLRTVQEGEVRRVGENNPRRVDVRVLAATNRDLRDEVARGRFRLDLLYRLDVIRVPVPPLRDRRDDIALLAESFWREATERIGSRATLGAATVGALARYDWPGNVRELQNVLAALAVRSPRRGVVPPSALPPCFAPAREVQSWRLEEARRTFDTQFVRAALARSGGHRGRAAEELGMTRQGLTKLMARLDVHDAPDEAPLPT